MDPKTEFGAEDVRRAAAELTAIRPAYAELIGFYAEIFAAQEEARPQVRIAPYSFPPERVRTRLAEQFPLVQVEELRFDAAVGRTLLERLCRIGVERSPTLCGAAAVIRQHSEQAAALFAGFLQGDESRLRQAASDAGVGTEALSFFLYHSLRPALCRSAEELSAFIPDSLLWEKGICPICGSPPAMSRIESDGRRSLFCGFCWHRWSARRTGCPFCGASDPDRLSTLLIESEPEYRIHTCEGCRRCLKTLDSRELARISYPALEHMATLHLDLKAAEAGYTPAYPARFPAS
jgi:FdhE protein